MLCAEFTSLDSKTFKNPKAFYRCVPEIEGLPDTPERTPGMCGGFGQHCCNSGLLETQCGAGLGCNLGAPLNRKLYCRICRPCLFTR